MVTTWIWPLHHMLQNLVLGFVSLERETVVRKGKCSLLRNEIKSFTFSSYNMVICSNLSFTLWIGTQWSATLWTWYWWICWKCNTQTFWKVDGCGCYVSFLPWAFWKEHKWSWAMVFWGRGWWHMLAIWFLSLISYLWYELGCFILCTVWSNWYLQEHCHLL